MLASTNHLPTRKHKFCDENSYLLFEVFIFRTHHPTQDARNASLEVCMENELPSIPTLRMRKSIDNTTISISYQQCSGFLLTSSLRFWQRRSDDNRAVQGDGRGKGLKCGIDPARYFLVVTLGMSALGNSCAKLEPTISYRELCLIYCTILLQ